MSASPSAPVRPHSLRAWAAAIRPRSLTLAASPVAVGAALAYARTGTLDVQVAGLALAAAALAYMGGPRPIAYTPLGEATAFAFFGPVAVAGTDWVLTGSVGVQALVAGAAIGALAAAALAINNRRDLEHDRAAGRRSFAVLFGADAARRLFEALLLAPFALVVALAFAAPSLAPLLPLALLPRALALRRDFARAGEAAAFNPLLLRCFGLVPAFALLLVLGVLLSA